jgi:2-keto-3-deoxy-6-phosphogluconate aldolase
VDTSTPNKIVPFQADWRRVISTLVAAAPKDVLIGVGTVMDDTVSLLPEIKSLGAEFAVSPINPRNFIDECKRVGLVAVPAGFTSNELWSMHSQGAPLLKMFHAGLVSPAILKCGHESNASQPLVFTLVN